MKRSSSEGFTRSAAMSDDEPLVNPSIDLTDEIRELRQRQKEFNATNEHDTYLIVVFSTSADRQEFLEQVNMREEHTFIDGYRLSRSIGRGPKKPAFKLQAPLNV